MTAGGIQEISLITVTERTGFLGRKTLTQEALRLKTSGGNIEIKKSAVEGAGDSWQLLIRRLQGLAKEKGVPFLVETQ